VASLQDRFEAKFTPEPMSGCWLWTGAKTLAGYGKLWDGSLELAHRVSYRLHKGTIAEGQVVCHRCDNPGCVNPEHLFVGSLKDNSQDAVKKQRNFTPRQENSKLTPDQVAEIHALPAKLPFGSLGTIAAHYGLSLGGLHKIRRRDRWGHV